MAGHSANKLAPSRAGNSPSTTGKCDVRRRWRGHFRRARSPSERQQPRQPSINSRRSERRRLVVDLAGRSETSWRQSERITAGLDPAFPGTLCSGEPMAPLPSASVVLPAHTSRIDRTCPLSYAFKPPRLQAAESAGSRHFGGTGTLCGVGVRRLVRDVLSGLFVGLAPIFLGTGHHGCSSSSRLVRRRFLEVIHLLLVHALPYFLPQALAKPKIVRGGPSKLSSLGSQIFRCLDRACHASDVNRQT